MTVNSNPLVNQMLIKIAFSKKRNGHALMEGLHYTN